MSRQFEALEYLARHDVLCKVNIVYIKGINDDHIDKIVQRAAALGVALTNIMPLIPTKNTEFENIVRPTGSEITVARKKMRKKICDTNVSL